MKLPLTGMCLCGSISYEISAPPAAAYVCHCADCQHGTGSAFSVAVLIADQAFRSTGGEARSVFGGVTERPDQAVARMPGLRHMGLRRSEAARNPGGVDEGGPCGNA